ncbi:YggS family pyridoxal phosphate-dependent enzyme [Acetobacter sp. AN02]|uniref:YggS family pyridoxal phosphate-dependent enzyme n=1 Tax=Acetobacter sp. AN02 TaxID=2894186 RepID=UPI0024340DD6|nr:YggS family pyridoxal phosphate-dependent enzyme [Acetobacter sp. AN02]MDG6095478.1 YggS family pyridoxal phosphate-dependent enzyme [Acetobacter sp. AN02]
MSSEHSPLSPEETGRIGSALHEVRERIAAAAQAAGRSAEAVTLVAVSKFHPQEAVIAALDAGQRVFGENRVQEAAAKFPPLRERWPDLRLHLIGGLQTNKAAEAVRIADMIESLDRPSLSDAIAKAAEKAGRVPDLLIEVNTGDEAQKAGVCRAEADGFIRDCRARFGAALKGLMCIPPADGNPAPHFSYLRTLADRHGLPVCSMGMSADYPAAIMAGADYVRVGTAIFGQRS